MGAKRRRDQPCHGRLAARPVHVDAERDARQVHAMGARLPYAVCREPGDEDGGNEHGGSVWL